MNPDTKRKIFIKILDSYGIGSCPQAGMRMTITRPFVDSWDCFGDGKDVIQTETMISNKWYGLCKGTWDFDYSNPYVKVWTMIDITL